MVDKNHRLKFVSRCVVKSLRRALSGGSPPNLGKTQKTQNRQEKFFCILCKFLCPLWFSFSIGANLCQSVDRDAKGAKDTKAAKDKIHRLHRLAQIFFCGICEICGFFSSIGANLCQSVDRDAKGAKDTKDAKKVTQRRREPQRTPRKNFCVLSKFLCPLWFSFSIGGCCSLSDLFKSAHWQHKDRALLYKRLAWCLQ